MYDTVEYANSRLADTVVRLDGVAVAIHRIDEGGDVHFTVLKDEAHGVCKLSDLDLTPVPLGFVHYSGQVIYVSRVPMRKDWKQGLRHNNCRIMYPQYTTHRLPSEVLHRCIAGEGYVSLDKACKKNGVIARKWAIVEGGVLLHKWHKVGKVVAGNTQFDAGKEYLESRFMEEVIHAR